MSSDFAAITSYFNPHRSADRARCYDRFAERMHQQGVELWTIEAALATDGFRFGESEYVQQTILPRTGLLWQKERLLNLLISRLPERITKIAWIDCDVFLELDDWSRIASEMLGKFPVIQLFDFATWLGPSDEVVHLPRSGPKRPGTAFLQDQLPNQAHDFSVGSPGFAWAARREILTRHGLYERDVTGGGDSVIAAGLFGWLEHNHLVTAGPKFKDDATRYATALHEDVRGEVGYLRSGLSHLWHGSFSERNYHLRHKALAEVGFDPVNHLCIDAESGLLRWTRDASPALQACVAEYLRFAMPHPDAEST